MKKTLCVGILGTILLSPVMAIAVTSGPSWVVDPEFFVGSGLNDTPGSAINFGSFTGGDLMAAGWIGANNHNDVDFYSFSLSSSNTLYFDIDYADGVNSDGEHSGLDAYLSVFDGSSRLIAVNDDSDLYPLDAGSAPDGNYDPYLGGLSLNAGTYYVAVSAYGNEPNAWWNQSSDLSLSGTLVSDAPVDATFYSDGPVESFGGYQLTVSETPAPVPLPGSLLLLGVGLAGLMGFRRQAGR